MLYLAFKDISLSKLAEDFRNAKYSWVVLSLFIGLLSHIIRAYRWNLLIRPLGYKPGLLNSYFAVTIGYLANFAFPRLGEVTRCASLSKTEKIP